ncbi:VirB6/TrbL-like conjugal transfer protein, CD1112 family [Clostridium arbusti]|uniref:VirB6/TrbL-like conjugal transfer protein, CD1112 family n=1 Tax=Clostridium arbusti TaxID=1137848 RepID=UPI00028A189C|nr:CD0415/CD1112 family protein [Clostridium arbusti]
MGNITDFVKGTFDQFGNSANKAVQLVSQSPQSNDQLWQVIVNVYNVVLPIGFVLVVAYFYMDMLGKSITLEYMRWENVAKTLFKLVVCKMILQNVLQLLTGIFAISSSIVADIGLSTNITLNSIDYTPIQQAWDKLGITNIGGMIMFVMNLGLLRTIMFIVGIAITVIVYGRMIEIYLYTALSPIPMAGLVGDNTRSTALNFIKSYAAVCLQGVVILVCVALYSGLLKSAAIGSGETGLVTICMYSCVLLLILVKSGSWAKKLTGAM